MEENIKKVEKQRYGEYIEEEARLNKEEKRALWDVSFGLQKVDYLQPSEYMISLANQNIQGEITLEEIESFLYTHYENETVEEHTNRSREADIVSTRINKLLIDDSFSLSPGTLKAIHHFLFKDVYSHAGTFRDVNLTKKEPIIGLNSIKYSNYFSIEDTLAYDFTEEKRIRYVQKTKEEVVKHISEFTSAIWQVHPFREGNTRTTAVFIERYLNTLGFNVDNSPFKDYSLYFRNALVRSNYTDYEKGIQSTDQFLNRFFENILFEGKNELKNRDMIAKEYLSKPEKELSINKKAQTGKQKYKMEKYKGHDIER